MRILVLSNLYPPNVIGGYERLCFEVTQGLAQAGHEMVVLTSRYGGKTAGDGRVIRDYLYVEDVAEALLLAARYDGPETVFNVGSGIGRSVQDVAEAICQVLGKPPPKFVYKRARQADVAANVMDTKRISQELGWSARTEWTQGVLRTAEWIERNFGIK